MKIRIISGIYGNRTIEGSGTNRTHPMSERIRNAIFNKIGNEIQGADVLDAFAGSGSLGLEALSRGAKSAVFIEKDRVAQNVITQNIDTLRVNKQAKLIKAQVSSYMKTAEQTFDIIFVDPPYHDPQLSTAMELIGLLRPNGLMVLSYPGRGEMPTELGVVVVDNRSYGTAALAFYRLEASE
ncbi:16S rRNA (guanine(966)-N(2))-methyltransferase RsmD [Candidatus Saccharibacteria bacterium]|nr:16S rRNA (guanine(966)-N(2))-methyltransferase RsmD [Candidatus Saccharibacteria bacterium]